MRFFRIRGRGSQNPGGIWLVTAREARNMPNRGVCDHCGEELGPEPVRRGEQVYCCEACTHDAARSVDCGGRADSHMSSSITEPSER